MKKPVARPDLSIVIPAYAEEKRIGKTLDALSKFLKTNAVLKKLVIEVLVVSADSPDKTHAIVRSKKKEFANLSLLRPGPKVGKGRDVQFGMLRAHGKTVVFMDADLATPLKHIPPFLKDIDKGTDIVIGTRNLLKHHPNFMRRLVSNTGNFLFRLAGGLWIEDSQCGFKMFTHEASELCFSRLTILGWGFDMEVLAIARANRLRIKGRRINDWVSVPEGTFSEGFIKNALVTLQELAYIFYNRLRRVYTRPPR